MRFAGGYLGSSRRAASTATNSRRSRRHGQVGVKWLVPSFVAMPFLMIWYWHGSRPRALLTLGIDTINSGTFSVVTRMALIIIVTSATIVGVAYFLAYRNPSSSTCRMHSACCCWRSWLPGQARYSREMLRKPFVIGRWMYSNGVRVPSVSKVNTNGYLAESNWVWKGSPSGYSRGGDLSRQCGSCHTLDGYRPLRRLLAGRDRANIETSSMLHENKADSHAAASCRHGRNEAGRRRLTEFLNAQVNPLSPNSPKVLTAKQ
jgi:hypothetical protein